MDLELREALAFGNDRAAALTLLLPGSEDHDYYRCLHAQHAGKLDEADAIIAQWSRHHGENARYRRLQLRQWLYRSQQSLAPVADKLRDLLGVDHWHEREVEERDPTRPTKLDPGVFTGATLLQSAVDNDNHLSQVTDEGIVELLGRALDDTRRRAVLSRLQQSADPGLVPMIADDLAVRDASFGALAIHSHLTTQQLRALAELRPELRTNATWVGAVVQRLMAPRDGVDMEVDIDARLDALAIAWKFLEGLPPAVSSLKVHVLWHLLDTRRKKGIVPDLKLLAAYLALPRYTNYAPSGWLRDVSRTDVAQVGGDFMSISGLPPASDDEGLVRSLVHELGDRALELAQWIEQRWLDTELAVARLLSGTGDIERATQTLGPSRAAELRERIDLAWCPHCPTRFGANDAVVLEAFVKNVPELTVKIFRVDPHAYFVHTQKEVGPELDLDGLAATSEQVFKIVEAPVRRLRKWLELPACARPGTYIVDLIGNGKSSRAVIHKGRLRYSLRMGAAGHVVTVVDETGVPRPDARAIVGEREYTLDDKASFVIPFSTTSSRVPMLLVAGDLASVEHVQLWSESPALDVTLLLDREGLSAGRVTRAVVRARLSLRDAPVSVSLLKRTTSEISLLDRAGVATTKSQPLALSDDDATVLEWSLADDTAQVSITVRGFLEIRSEQREQEITVTRSFALGAIHATDEIETLFLAHTAGGWVLFALGKNGEPRAQRPVSVGLVHRWSSMQLDVALATDARGRVELGSLPGVTRITATLGDQSRAWSIDAPLHATVVHAVVGDEIVVALPAHRDAVTLIPQLSVVEQRAGVNVSHASPTIKPLASGIAITGLDAGTYEARAPGVIVSIVVTPKQPRVGNVVFPSGEVIELTRRGAVVESITASDQVVRIALRGATEATRVHVLASTFVSSLVEPPRAGPDRAARRRGDHARGVQYVSGRELGDEYRYVLERRSAKRFPGLLLDRPALLLNPWARRATSTSVQHATVGGSFGATAMRARSPGAPKSDRGGGGGENPDAFASYDFLAAPPAVLANLVPDEAGVVTINTSALGSATTVTIVVDDPAGVAIAFAHLPEGPLATRDRRLVLALDPSVPATQTKQITPLAAGGTLVIDDLATAKVHLIDSVERAHSYLLALRDDATLREFAFVTRWHTTPDSERRELYTKHACHELHLFLWAKDRPFFDAIVKPYLAHKRTKTFIDHFLLDADLTPYLEPTKLSTLNAVERALLVRKVAAGPLLARLLADEVAMLPPDPARDTQIIDTLLGSATLDGDEQLHAFAESAAEEAELQSLPMMDTRFSGGPPGAAGAAASMPAAMAPPRAPSPKKRARSVDREEMDDDMAKRDDAAPPLYRVADKTQEWAEHNWWHRTPGESGAGMITANRLWRDLALHSTGLFLSPSLGLATTSFAEAMCALAVTELPFVAGAHAMTATGPRLEIVAASAALAGSSQLVPGTLVSTGAPLVIGMTYVRADDSHEYINGEQIDKYVTGPFATGVVYTCRVVIANPTTARQRISALVQIPRGSIPVLSGVTTKTLDIALSPYGTFGHEVSFYFPEAGTTTQFPVHASRGGQIVAAATTWPLEVTSAALAHDPGSWAHVSQHGTIAEVIAFLATANLGAIELSRPAWRCRERAAYDAITTALEQRGAYEDDVWGYSLLHGDAPRARVFLRARAPGFPDPGPVLEMLDLDGEDLATYEHLEYAPLINARAHRLGAKTKILNDGLSAQYERFLDLVAHRPTPTSRDLLAATHYAFAQDRNELALSTLPRIRPDELAEVMQSTYLGAYAALLQGETAGARQLVEPYRDHPVDRWRHKFGAMLAMLDELDGKGAVVVDPRSREQQHADTAARQPTFALAVDREGILITSQHITSIELRFFVMDVELLFSRQPFVQSDVSRFSFIEPGHRQTLTNLAPEQRVAWPDALRGKNVVVEAVGAGLRKAHVHYANDLSVSIANHVGRLRVTRGSNGLPAAYVKVFARKRNGPVTFYKDGYTDLRGWFDYSSLSTDELDHVERFAILVCSDEAGAAILEAAPPQR